MDYYLAIDLGASGGRHILMHETADGIVLEEVYRFSNGPVRQDGALVWDVERIFTEIVAGIKKCAELGKAPRSAGIDTWGVDYVLVDRNGEAVLPAYSYRDGRPVPFMNTPVSAARMYAVTGIPAQPINTVYQLLADKAAGRLDRAECFFMLPEYFSCRLIGSFKKDSSEYTAASTTGLLDAQKRDWAFPLINELGLPARLFVPVREPPYSLGHLSGEIKSAVGFDMEILMIASHDTASAVSVVDLNRLYISSGTWSLLGIQSEPVLTEAACNAGYSNEGALGGRVCFLKNIMGLWMLQQTRHELGDAYSFSDLEQLARETAEAGASFRIDVNAPCFLSPRSMVEALRDECRRRGKPAPQTPGELAFCIYDSLAESYRKAVADLECITGRVFPAIQIIGGGSRDTYLNSLTGSRTGKSVIAGPVEATALGNINLQRSYH
jgi:rhamnulokinase